MCEGITVDELALLSRDTLDLEQMIAVRKTLVWIAALQTWNSTELSKTRAPGDVVAECKSRDDKVATMSKETGRVKEFQGYSHHTWQAMGTGLQRAT